MITPEFLNEIIKGTEKNVSELQEYLIVDICKHIVGTFTNNEDKIFMPSTINQMHKLMDSGMVLDDIQKQIEKRLPSLKREIRNAFLISAQEISDHNTEIAKEIVDSIDNNGNPVQIEIPEFEKVGLPKETSQLNMTPTEVRKLEQIYTSTNKTVTNLTKTLPSACETKYIELCDKAFMKAQSGVSIDKAIQEAIREASEQGLHIVNYDSGHKDTIEVAIARAVRSGINKANAEIVLTRCGEMGINYVLVSEHLGARVTKYNDYTNHSLWQGQVYKLDWNKSVLKGFKPNEADYKGFKWLKDIKNLIQKFKDRNYPDFVTTCGYGELLGICGVNCRHTFSAFYPNIQEKPKRMVDAEENKKRYEQEQHLRAMERAYRKKKTELEALKNSGLKGKDVDKRIDELTAKTKQLEKDILIFSRTNKLPSANWRKQTTYSRMMSEKEQDKEQNMIGINRTSQINKKAIYNPNYKNKFKKLGESEDITNKLYNSAKTILEHRNGTLFEDLYFIDSKTGIIRRSLKNSIESRCSPTKKMKQLLIDNEYNVIGMHNHPQSTVPSIDDLQVCIERKYKYGIIVGHNGQVIKYSLTNNANLPEYATRVALLNKTNYNTNDIKAFAKKVESAGIFIEVL